MRLVVQRVKSASVSIDGAFVSASGPGVLCLVGIHVDDDKEDMEYCARKLLGAKLWDNENEKPWRKSLVQLNKELLCVSQFTLYGGMHSKKHIPDYKLSMPAKADEGGGSKEFYLNFLSKLKEDYPVEGKIFDGVFGAMMDVELVNDGPVTLVIDSPPKVLIDEGKNEA